MLYLLLFGLVQIREYLILCFLVVRHTNKVLNLLPINIVNLFYRHHFFGIFAILQGLI